MYMLDRWDLPLARWTHSPFVASVYKLQDHGIASTTTIDSDKRLRSSIMNSHGLSTFDDLHCFIFVWATRHINARYCTSTLAPAILSSSLLQSNGDIREFVSNDEDVFVDRRRDSL